MLLRVGDKSTFPWLPGGASSQTHTHTTLQQHSIVHEHDHVPWLMTATGRGQWERRGFTGRWAALGLLVASVCFVSLSIPNTSLPRSALLSYPEQPGENVGFPRSLRSALDVSTLPPLAEEAHAVGAGWAAGRGRGLVVRPFGGAALYLDVNGNPVTNHYGGGGFRV